jgi:hypothetical protein
MIAVIGMTILTHGLNMKKIYYEKKGRRYVPVAEYDNDFLDSFTKGNHLVMCYPGGTSRRFNIEPALAPMIAAGRLAEDAMCTAMNKASELKPSKKPITEEQRAAWQHLAKTFGDEMYTLHGTSVRDIVEAGIQSQLIEAEKLLKHPAVKEAYDHFMFVAKLAYEDPTK